MRNRRPTPCIGQRHQDKMAVTISDNDDPPAREAIIMNLDLWGVLAQEMILRAQLPNQNSSTCFERERGRTRQLSHA